MTEQELEAGAVHFIGSHDMKEATELAVIELTYRDMASNFFTEMINVLVDKHSEYGGPTWRGQSIQSVLDSLKVHVERMQIEVAVENWQNAHKEAVHIGNKAMMIHDSLEFHDAVKYIE